jgi:hypothetical protein
MLNTLGVFLQVESEVPVYEAVMAWTRHDPVNKGPYLPQLLRHVRLPLLSAKFITDVVDNEVGCKNVVKFAFLSFH